MELVSKKEKGYDPGLNERCHDPDQDICYAPSDSSQSVCLLLNGILTRDTVSRDDDPVICGLDPRLQLQCFRSKIQDASEAFWLEPFTME